MDESIENEEKLFEDKLDLKYLIESDKLIKEMRVLIDKNLETAFRKILDYSEKFYPLFDKYNEINNRDYDSLQKKDTYIVKEWIDELKYFEEQMQKEPPIKQIGIISLDTSEMNKEIKKAASDALFKIQTIVPKYSYEKLNELIEELKKVDEQLVITDDRSLDEYVAFLKFLQYHKDKEEAYTELVVRCRELNQIMTDSKMNVPEKNKIKLNETDRVLTKVKKSLSFILEKEEAKENQYKRILDEEVTKLTKKVEEEKTKLEKDDFEKTHGETFIRSRLERKESGINLTYEENVDEKKHLMENVRILESMGKTMNSLENEKNKIREHQLFLHLDPNVFEDIHTVIEKHKNLSELWNGIKNWGGIVDQWKNNQFEDIDVQSIQKETDMFTAKAAICRKNLGDNPATQHFKDKVLEIKDSLPVVINLRDPSLEERHWNEINEVVGIELKTDDPELTLHKLLELKVSEKEKSEKIAEIAAKAANEKNQNEQYQKIKISWESLTMTCKEKNDTGKKIYIIEDFEEVNQDLDEMLVNLQSIINNRNSYFIRHEVEITFKEVSIFQEILEEWMMLQRSYLYLENIFSSPSIKESLQNEEKRFRKVDSEWRKFMELTFRLPKAIDKVRKPQEKFDPKKGRTTSMPSSNTLDDLRKHNKEMDNLQKRLENYLEEKRKMFPRFYFLSNDELLEILAGGKDPNSVQPHLKKLFENIYSLVFEPDDPEMLREIISAEGERVGALGKLKSGVESLQELEKTMKKTVKNFIKKSYDYFNGDDFERKKWIENNPSQSVTIVDSISWSLNTEILLGEPTDIDDNIELWLDEQIQLLDDLTDMVRKDLNPICRRTVVALITQDVHYRDIIERIRDEGVRSVHDFRWQQQLRYDYELNEVIIKQLNALLEYGLEYMGATTRLVITPLTDRCWMTITGALRINMGASPVGPAGTGKTESTKDLAKALGKFCIVFNCSEQVTSKMIDQLFEGLKKVGAWSCLDEFNRIDIEVLSVIAQILQDIRHEMLMGLIPNKSMNTDAGINTPNFGIFVTMNPGYKGRTELPDNLKILFRPMSMMIPDYTYIAEIMLFAEGFNDARNLSIKMTKLYKLCSEQLSQQYHYDFGMRAVKSVLSMAGNLKRNNPELSEDVVLIRAMKNSNLPKFLESDIPLFESIVTDLFPGVMIPNVDQAEFEDGLKKAITDMNLQYDRDLIEKVIQLLETLKVRFGTMIVGDTLTGKTTIRRSLKAALNLLHKKKPKKYPIVTKKEMNPKAISMGELYGKLDPNTKEWCDGLASSIFRTIVEKKNEKNENIEDWIIFDGPVDSIWVENLNTVLDDNMTLCLSNGQRIKLKESMRVLFEVSELSGASPATISRCGMIYLNQKNLKWNFIKESWLKKVHEEDPELYCEKLVAHLSEKFDNFIEKGLEARAKMCEPIPTSPMNIVMTFCSLFEAVFLKEYSGREYNERKKLSNKMFIFCFGWAFGGGLSEMETRKIDVFISNEFNPQDAYKESVYDAYVTCKISNFGDYVPWEDIKEEFVYNRKKSYFELVVSTNETTKYSWLLEHQLMHGNSVFFTGMTGVGKTIIANSTLRKMKKENDFEVISFNFSSQTSSLEVQEAIEDKLVRKKKTLLAGENGRDVALFLDDVNMPTYDEYGTQPVIELLRQYQDSRGFYDREKRFWKEIERMTLVCAAAPPGGGRKVLSTRFTRHFHIINLPAATEDSLTQIFETILTGFLESFNQEIKSLNLVLTKSTLKIYSRISLELLPTPQKSHYVFNLRDVSKVFQGMLMASEEVIQTEAQMIRLWVHECTRVFHDRLINMGDKEWFYKTINELLANEFKVEWDLNSFEEKNQIIVFGDYLRSGLEENQKRYEEINDLNKLKTIMVDYAEMYNLFHKDKMNLSFFRDYMEHLSRILRIMRQPRGNVMLIGVGGSGKQTLTKLSSYISNCVFQTVEIKKNYNQADFREEIKRVMTKAGVERLKTLFFLNDNHIVKENFLEDINNILNSGEIPNMWLPEEKDAILSEIRDEADKRGMYEYYNFFVDCVRENLHIVLCMSPAGDKLRVRIRMFPSLVNCCTIDWITQWPKEALQSVALGLLEEMEMFRKPETKNKLKDLSELAVYAHKSVNEESEIFFQTLRRHIYTTPKNYLDLMKMFQKIYTLKNEKLYDKINRMNTGVSKLDHANSEVGVLKKELDELRPKLDQKTQDIKLLMAKLNQDRLSAEKNEERVRKETEKDEIANNEAKELKEIVQARIDEAEPMLLKAKEGLNNLEPKKINEMRLVSVPVPTMKFLFETLAIMLGKKPDDYKSILNAGLCKQLQGFNPEEDMKESIYQKVNMKVKSNPEFTVERVESANTSAKCLAEWIFAIIHFYPLNKEIQPQKKELAEREKNLQITKKKLDEMLSFLKVEQDKVKALENEYNSVLDERDKLFKQIAKINAKVDIADKLLQNLPEERERWRETFESLTADAPKVLGDSFICAACISYFGAFTGPFRNILIQRWKEKCQELNILFSENFVLSDQMIDPVQIQRWQLQGLPSDQVSIDNAVLVQESECVRWPLLIDPQAQATKWMKQKMEKELLPEVSFVMKRNGDLSLYNAVASALSTGDIVMIEDIQELLDPALEPILSRQIVMNTNTNRPTIRFQDKDIDYHPKFKLYLSTSLPNPHFLPEVFIRTTVINFTVTELGLEEQLLSEIVRKINSELERERNETSRKLLTLQENLTKTELMILNFLLAEKGNILDSQDLVEKLTTAKEQSKETNRSYDQSLLAKEKNNKERERYKPLATRGSILYFVISDLVNIDPMYQFSLSFFIKQFNQIIDKAPTEGSVEEKIILLEQNVTESIFINVCRGLFNQHKLIFSFFLTIQILRNKKTISDKEWSIFLRGVSLDEKLDKIRNPDSKTISKKAWDLILAYQNASPAFQGIARAISDNYSKWKEWITSKEPQNEKLPGSFEDSLTQFQKILLLKAFRDEKIAFKAIDFITDNLGRKFAFPGPPNLEEVFEEANCRTPIVFVLSQGADPTSLIQRFVKKVKGSESAIKSISLGEGQGPKAKKEIDEAKMEGQGGWVLLQNCHLSKSWMDELGEIVENITEGKVVTDEGFRLMLTSMPCNYFPINILQNGLKITIEPPDGIKTNLSVSLQSIINEKMEEMPKPEECKKMVFSLCFFHAILQERRKFGPLGWNRFYEFNESDLETGVTVLMNLLKAHEEVPWDSLRFVLGEITWGGRVTDDQDRRCLISIVNLFINENIINEPNYAFTTTDAYRIPSSTSLEEMLEYVHSLPAHDEPEIFGMNENANLACQKQDSDFLVKILLNIQPSRSSGSSGKSSEQEVQETSLKIEKSLPAIIKESEFHKNLFGKIRGNINSLTTYVLQEVSRFNILITVMTESLQNINKALKGEVVMSDELDQMSSSILDNRVPKIWEDHAYPSMSPLGEWVTNLKSRVEFIRNWVSKGHPSAFWLPCFFFPQGFLTAITQNFARKYQIAIDELSFAFEIQKAFDPKDLITKEEDAVYIYGLFIEAGKIDMEQLILEDAIPGETYSPAPVISFIPTQNYEPESEDYECPLYKTPERAGTLSTTGHSTNFIISIDIPSFFSPDYWILKGTALLCQKLS